MRTSRKNRSYDRLRALISTLTYEKNDQNVVIGTKFSEEKGVKTFFNFGKVLDALLKNRRIVRRNIFSEKLVV